MSDIKQNTEATESVLSKDIQDVQVEKELSSFEKKMVDHGWDPEGKLSAEDWIDNGFKVKNKKLDNLFNAIETLKVKLAKQETESYARAKAELEAQRLEAIKSANVEAVKEIEQRQTTMVNPEIREHADLFVEKNKKWLQGQSYLELEMAAVATAKDRDLVKQGLHPADHFAQIEAHIKERYPDYFGIEKAPEADAVQGKQVSISRNKKKSVSFDDLDEFQKKAAKKLADQGIMTIEEYILKSKELDKSHD